MTLNTAFAPASEVSTRTLRIKWPLVVAGALAAASAIDLTTGFSLTAPQELVAGPIEVQAVVHEIDELESRKKAASIEELPPQF
jgi:hypothetical protein